MSSASLCPELLSKLSNIIISGEDDSMEQKFEELSLEVNFPAEADSCECEPEPEPEPEPAPDHRAKAVTRPEGMYASDGRCSVRRCQDRFAT
jgi:hypothetical protein